MSRKPAPVEIEIEGRKYITTTEAARLLNRSKQGVDYVRKQGAFPGAIMKSADNYAETWYMPLDEVEAFNEHTTPKKERRADYNFKRPASVKKDEKQNAELSETLTASPPRPCAECNIFKANPKTLCLHLRRKGKVRNGAPEWSSYACLANESAPCLPVAVWKKVLPLDGDGDSSEAVDADMLGSVSVKIIPSDAPARPFSPADLDKMSAALEEQSAATLAKSKELARLSGIYRELRAGLTKMGVNI